MRRCLLLPAFAFFALARQPAPPAFEVASVKVSDTNPQPIAGAGGPFRAVRGGCRRPDPGSVNCTSATLKTILVQAYDVKDYQIEGPAWLDSDKFDLKAKIPEGVPAQQVPAMLRALLAERFKVIVHKETKSLPAYELTVAKGGPKLKEVDPAEVAAFNAAQEAARGGSAGAPPPPASAAGRAGSAAGSPPLGSLSISVSTSGARTLRGKMTMAQIVNMLSNQLSRPVLDNTALKGTYDIELSYLAAESDPTQANLRALGPPSGAAAGGIGGSGGGAPATDLDAPIATIFQALQESLGLRLDAKKSPIEVVIVDSANRLPTEN